MLQRNDRRIGATRLTDRLLDTDAVSAAVKGSEIFQRYLRGISDRGRLHASVTVEGEIRFGIARLSPGKKRRLLTGALAQVLESLHDVLPISRPVALEYSMMKADLWSRGKPIEENDLWIASTALLHNLTLVTHDTHFMDVRGLSVEDWTQP